MGAFDDIRPQMTQEEFRLLRDVVYEYCGIAIREDLKYVMERRLLPRLEQLALNDFATYYRYLRFDPGRKAELDTAVEALTTNETYFFREPLQLQAFSEELIPIVEEKNARSRRLRIWSAGCSSGEEAYTVAMLLRADGRFDTWDVEVYGTDISKRVLNIARRAEYGASSMRSTSPELQARWFDAAPGNKLKVKEEIRRWVTFGHLNLLDETVVKLVPRMDVIFCRNVMIYFDAAARKRVLKVFHEKLSEGGYLLLGHSESLISLSADFELVHFKSDLVYRKPEAAP